MHSTFGQRFKSNLIDTGIFLVILAIATIVGSIFIGAIVGIVMLGLYLAGTVGVIIGGIIDLVLFIALCALFPPDH